MTDPGAAPLVYVIVVNFNGRRHLEYSLPSILRSDYTAFRVLVVDNRSSDGSADYVATAFPDVELLRSPTNSGWAGGNNQGIAHACEKGARYVLLANPDVRVHPAWIDAAVRTADLEPRVGLVGFEVFSGAGEGSLEAFERACDSWNSLRTRPTDVIGGAALFVRLAVFQKIGRFDEAFFCYGEEIDLERRARDAGYRMLATNAPVWHHTQGIFERYPIRAAWFATRNRLRLSLKHDRPRRVARTFVRLLDTACNPFFQGDLGDVTVRRLRPRGVLFNAGLLGLAVLWNAWHLLETRRARRRDGAAAQQAGRELAAGLPPNGGSSRPSGVASGAP